MMLSKNEKKILKLIKYAPVLIVGFFSIFITYLIFLDKNVQYNRDINDLKNRFLDENINRITIEVNRTYKYIQHEKANSEERLKSLIKDKVKEAHKNMTFIYEKYKDIESKEKIINRIKDSLRNYRFNQNRGYFYIYEKTGKNIMLPSQPYMESEDFWNHQDLKGSFIIQDMVHLLEKESEPFYEWYWYKPGDNTSQRKKIGVVKEFKPYELFIGTGEYIDDFENELKEKILSYIHTLKYSDNGYVFIVDYNGKYLSHIKKEYIGLNRISLKDKNGFMITKEIINTAKEGSGFLKYIGTIKPETKLPSEKTTYVKGFDDWKWSIATGFYTDELEKKVEIKQEEIRKRNADDIFNFFTISSIFIFIFIVLSFYISKILEKQFSKYKKEVSKQIRENRQKDTMLAQQSKMAAMGEMLQNIAHQWRQPLSLISTVSTGVKFNKEHGVLNDESLLASMDRINESTKYLSQTIEDFMDFFNPNKKRVFFNLNTTINKVINLLELQFNQNSIDIILEIDDLEVYGYENELIQVIINICNNSRDELVKSSLEKKLILIKTQKKNNKVCITIKDNAGGIDQNIIDRIFEPYFTTKHKSQGTGIGLYMSQEIIVKHMNGSLTAKNVNFSPDNVKGKGAMFTITLDLD
jgi:signal transduction histidine kinase